VFRTCQLVPDDFLFAFKVTGDITIKRFPKQSRFGGRAGEANKHFLDAEGFEAWFLKGLKVYRENVGLLMFEFSKFYPADYARGRDFLADLDRFFSALPKGWPYAVEIRNSNFLKPDYFELLRKHAVAHVYNNWSAMPTVGEQMAMEGSLTNPQLCAARFLLTPGRKYQEAVDTFAPYKEVQIVNPEARVAGAQLLNQGAAAPGRRTFILVNNCLEGNAPTTIAAMLEEARRALSYGTSAAADSPLAVFGALSFWWMGEHGHPRIDTSEHIYFANDQLATRFIEEIDFDYAATDATAALITAAS